MLLQVITDQTASYFLPISSTAKLCIEAGCCLLFSMSLVGWMGSGSCAKIYFCDCCWWRRKFLSLIDKVTELVPRIPIQPPAPGKDWHEYKSVQISFKSSFIHYSIVELCNIWYCQYYHVKFDIVNTIGIRNVSSAERWLPDMEAGGRYNHLLLGFQATIVQGASLRLLHPPSLLQPSATQRPLSPPAQRPQTRPSFLNVSGAGWVLPPRASSRWCASSRWGGTPITSEITIQTGKTKYTE